MRNMKKLETAVMEAERFLERAKAVQASPVLHQRYNAGPKETGALRRSSLDLTRALADLRSRK